MVLPQLVELSARLGAPLVATNDLHYTERSDAGAHDALLCIQTNAKISDPGRFKFDAEEFYLKTAEEMRTLFAERPDACDNTLAIAERCDLSIEFGTLHLPPFVPPTEESQEQYLRRLVAEGATSRYGDPLSPEARDRIEHELGIILRMGFAGYFLIVADLIQFARSRGIRVGPGRGSAAGSVVSYCLRITDLDPIRYGLIFERFLNPDRRQMPDIDMDFDERGRGEMIRYATERYGEDHVAQIVTFGTIKGKQAIRDAARVLDLPYGIGDRLAKMYPPPILGKDAPLAACFDKTVHWPDPGTNEAYSQASDLRKANDEDEISRRVLDIARELEGLRRQVSVHAAGVVIGDEPLVNYTPLQRAQDGAGGIVTQYEMHAVENLGPAQDGLPRPAHLDRARGRRPERQTDAWDPRRHRRGSARPRADLRDAHARRHDRDLPAGVAGDARARQEAPAGPVRGRHGARRAVPSGPARRADAPRVRGPQARPAHRRVPARRPQADPRGDVRDHPLSGAGPPDRRGHGRVLHGRGRHAPQSDRQEDRRRDARPAREVPDRLRREGLHEGAGHQAVGA